MQTDVINESRGSFVERLAEKLGGRAQVETVFGSPIERDGVTVIPVARVRYGLGGGSGMRESQEGGGGGGGVQAVPAGYIEVSGGHAAYRAFEPWRSWGRAAIGIGLGTWLLLSGVRAIVEATTRPRLKDLWSGWFR